MGCLAGLAQQLDEQERAFNRTWRPQPTYHTVAFRRRLFGAQPTGGPWGLWCPEHGWARDERGKRLTFDRLGHARQCWATRFGPAVVAGEPGPLWRVKEVTDA